MMDTIFLKLLNMSICAGWLILAVIVLRAVLKKNAEMGALRPLGVCRRAARLPVFPRERIQPCAERSDTRCREHAVF